MPHATVYILMKRVIIMEVSRLQTVVLGPCLMLLLILDFSGHTLISHALTTRAPRSEYGNTESHNNDDDVDSGDSRHGLTHTKQSTPWLLVAGSPTRGPIPIEVLLTSFNISNEEAIASRPDIFNLTVIATVSHDKSDSTDQHGDDHSFVIILATCLALAGFMVTVLACIVGYKKYRHRQGRVDAEPSLRTAGAAEDREELMA